MLVRLRAVSVTGIASDSGAGGIVGGDGETVGDENGGLVKVDGRHVPPDGLVLLGVLELQNGDLVGVSSELDGDTTTVGVDLPVLVVSTTLGLKGLHVLADVGGGPEVDGLVQVVVDLDTGATSSGGGGNHIRGGGASDHGGRGSPGGGSNGSGVGSSDRAAGGGNLDGQLNSGLAGGGGLDLRSGGGGRGGGGLRDLGVGVDGHPVDLSDDIDNNVTLLVGVLVAVSMGTGRDHTGQGGSKAESSNDTHCG